MMILPLRPTLTVDSARAIDFGALRHQGVRACLFDLDGTLCPRGTTHLAPFVFEFLWTLAQKGFRIGILSNRRRNADDPILIELSQSFPVMTESGKPGRRSFVHMLSVLDATPDEAAMIGDKWITDILGAHRAGLAAAIRVRRPLCR